MKHLYNYNVLFYLQATSRKKNYQICGRCNFVFILKKIKLPTHTHFLSIAVSYCQKRRSVSEGSYWISVFFLPFLSLYHWFTSLSKSRIRNLLLVVKDLACFYKKKKKLEQEGEREREKKKLKRGRTLWHLLNFIWGKNLYWGKL